jgi:DNA-binding LacI/PurR family transcriptional regulator
LTAIAQPVCELGQKAAEVLFSQIKGGENSSEIAPIMLPTKLIARQSVKSIV